jgi:T5orf172 domain
MLRTHARELMLPHLKHRWVYGIKSGQYIKIGVASSLPGRMKHMQLYNPHAPEIVLKKRILAAFHCEKKMHEVLKEKSLGREWFDVTVPEVYEAYEIGKAYAGQVYARECARLGIVDTHGAQSATKIVKTIAGQG